MRNPAGTVVIIPKRFVRSGERQTAKADFGQTLKKQRLEEIASYSRMIQSGRLKPGTLADYYCKRASEYSKLNMMKQAFGDLDRAVKLQPEDADTWACWGDVHLRAADFDASVQDYSKAISFGKDRADLFRGRGDSEFYGGNPSAAIEDLTRASAIGDDYERTYADISLAIAYMRLEKPLPDDLVARAGANPRGAWPHPVLAVMGGRLSPEDLLKVLEQKSGDENRTAGTEAHYYLGHYYLHLGDKEKARAEFLKARDYQVFTYLEFAEAQFELNRLNATPPETTSAISGPVPDPKKEVATPLASEEPTPPKKRKRADHIDPNWNANPLQ